MGTGDAARKGGCRCADAGGGVPRTGSCGCVLHRSTMGGDDAARVCWGDDRATATAAARTRLSAASEAARADSDTAASCCAAPRLPVLDTRAALPGGSIQLGCARSGVLGCLLGVLGVIGGRAWGERVRCSASCASASSVSSRTPACEPPGRPRLGRVSAARCSMCVCLRVMPSSSWNSNSSGSPSDQAAARRDACRGARASLGGLRASKKSSRAHHKGVLDGAPALLERRRRGLERR